MQFVKQHYFLLLIIVLAIGLRLWGVNFGLPFQFHQDEPIVVNHALAYGTGDFNPHFFIIPPLTSYLLFILYALYFIVMSIVGSIKGSEQFALSFFQDPTSFYLIGRIGLGVVPSVLCVFGVYALSRKFFSVSASLFSALVMALASLNVIHAKYIYPDNLLVLCVILVMQQLISLLKEPKTRIYLSAGILTGIAIATKYNAGVLIGSLLVAHAFVCDGKNRVTFVNKKLAVFLLGSALAFFVCNPFALFDGKFFFESVTGKIRHSYMGWAHHIVYSLFEGAGFFVTLSGIIGLCFALQKKRKHVLVMLSFCVLFYLHLVFTSQEYPRYVLALIPFIAMGAGYLYFELLLPRATKKSWRIIIVASAFAALIPSAAKSIKADLLFAKKDTRIEAAEWFQKTVAAQAKIACDHTFFRPAILQSRNQLIEKERILDKQPELSGLKAKKLAMQMKALDSVKGKTFNVYFLAGDDEFSGQFLNFWPVIGMSLEGLQEAGIEYVVFSNINPSESAKMLHSKIASRFELVAEFSPYTNGGFAKPRDLYELTGLPLSTEELFARVKPGPSMVIYRLR
ncbi:MAG: glycosyltransferase family 39 protein [Candidatus Omnitrophica bacterium]|nr:glycosyltransferase family 39 protein [Candidatus Omnitrophota bacterium]